MSSHWTGVFPCRQAAASSVAKTPSEKIVPTRGVPLGSGGLLSDQGNSSQTRGPPLGPGASSQIRGPPLGSGGLLSDRGASSQTGGLLSDRGASSQIGGPPLGSEGLLSDQGTPLRPGELLSDQGTSSQTIQWWRSPFYWTGALTSLCCSAGFATTLNPLV